METLIHPAVSKALVTCESLLFTHTVGCSKLLSGVTDLTTTNFKKTWFVTEWMGCRRYFVWNRLEVLVDENDFRSSSRGREHGSFLLVSQLHVAIQTLWSQCVFPRVVWANRWIVHFQRVSPFLHDLRLLFRLRLCLDLNVQHTLAHNWKQVSLTLSLHWCFLNQVRHVCRFPEHSIPMVDLSQHVSLSYNWILGFWLGLFGVITSRNIRTQFFDPIVLQGNLRSHHDSLRDAISWERVLKDDCVRSCLIELKPFLNKFDVNPIQCFSMVTSTLSACTVQDVMHPSQCYTNLCVLHP